MFVYFITRRSRKPQPRRAVGRRDDAQVKGEIMLGGGSRGGGGGGSIGRSSGGSRSGSSSSRKSSSSGGAGEGEGSSSSGGSGGKSGGKSGSSSGISTSSGGGSSSAVVSGKGGGKSVVITSGQPFAGRTAGGGTRTQIYGTRQYGSGYPGITGRGTAGRGFPFYFWPVVWAGADTGYLYPTEYGSPSNTSRPGGPLVSAPFSSNTTNTTFRIISDNQTVIDLIGTITSSCSSDLQTTNITATLYNDSAPIPQPEQVIQYYRASSIALTLDGYNNTADLTNSTSDVPLPSNIDQNLLTCLNATIGNAAPLVNAASGSGIASSVIRTAPTTGLLGLALIIWMLLL
ncbi:hypothetical protein F5887DRAFT_1129407 [Amanita rubescens]|nr:hypothetical protein F5887DRAFT_1129407 [Amanita rubescens]